ncbi:carnosine synthase 1 [Aspergillus udagawae]|uniref:Carnosine synthase 1 n=1 Tax=Aspergillus udagawae TaxID=91492 RepID=A0A8H3SBG3_9EURO|nr:carnosine synthase 1 [Aspergillus udagawae]
MATQERLQVRSKNNEGLFREYSFILSSPPTESSWQSLDFLFWEEPGYHGPDLLNAPDDIRIFQLDQDDASKEITPASLGSPKAFGFLLQILRASASGAKCAVKLIVPLHSGFIVRSDIIPLRLRDSEYVESALSFAEPLQTYSGKKIAISSRLDLTTYFAAATAGLILRQGSTPVSDAGHQALFRIVESDLENRLSFPWIQPGTPRRRTLALVDANSSHPEDGLGFYRAARELGINVVVLENSGHWLEDPAQAQWREAFIPTRLTNPPEEDVGDHILASLRAYGKPVDGIVTFADSFWYYIAQIAHEIGVDTAPPDSMRIATNKFLTSKYVGHEAYLASNVDEALKIAEEVELPYPLIVKPCDGWSSEGVSRVESPDAFPAAIKSIDTSRHGTEFVMEPYCDGPEVDVNLVLLDGQVLFAEICDDLPKSADVNGPTVGSLTNFHELNSVYPSALPSQELDLLINSFVGTLLSLGIRNGVMHLEGRVENSSMEYREQNGMMDLQPRAPQATRPEPSAWLIEINPRPLGMTGSHIIESTYGIDYWGLAVVLGVGDKDRARALSKPYRCGPQYTCIMVFIPADFPPSSQGIFDTDDICADLLARRPDLAKHISRCATLVKRGQKVAHPTTGRHTFLAYFNVFSRAGRQEALDLARQVREEVRYSFL